jgi:hypothetical protein
MEVLFRSSEQILGCFHSKNKRYFPQPVLQEVTACDHMAFTKQEGRVCEILFHSL